MTSRISNSSNRHQSSPLCNSNFRKNPDEHNTNPLVSIHANHARGNKYDSRKGSRTAYIQKHRPSPNCPREFGRLQEIRKNSWRSQPKLTVHWSPIYSQIWRSWQSVSTFSMFHLRSSCIPHTLTVENSMISLAPTRIPDLYLSFVFRMVMHGLSAFG